MLPDYLKRILLFLIGTGKVAMVEMRLLDFDKNVSLRGETLQKAIEEDRSEGKIPVFVSKYDCIFNDGVTEIVPKHC